MTSVKVKFTPSSVILKEGSVHYQIIHHCKVRHIRTGYKLFQRPFPNKEMHQPIESGIQPFHCGPYNRTLHCS